MMDVMSLLRRYGIRPSKGLGQNFLTEEWVYERIIAASDLSNDDLVLEIGPGLGTLTRRLAETARNVVAVELDQRMVTILRDTLAGLPNVTVVQGDILEMDPVALLEARRDGDDGPLRYKVVANLPYYITSRVLRHLLEAAVRPERLTLMVQREVADRIVAEPGDMSILAVSVQVFGRPERVCKVPPSAFYPQPNVSSAVLTIHPHSEPLVPEELLDNFFRVVRAGFQQRRKQIHNSLTANLSLSREHVMHALEEAGIEARRRPQRLSVDDWRRLTLALFAEDNDDGPVEARR